MPTVAWKSQATTESWRRAASRVTEGGIERRKYTSRVLAQKRFMLSWTCMLVEHVGVSRSSATRGRSPMCSFTRSSSFAAQASSSPTT